MGPPIRGGYHTNIEIHGQGIYQSGVIQPEQPLELPEGTKVRFVLVPESDGGRPVEQVGDGAPAERPLAPRISAEELMERIRKYSISAPSLPADFSREDIFSDHD